MFNLIVAVISIALIAAMAAASIFYGGSAFGEGTAKAQASTLINNGQQISGAQQLYMIDNSGNRADAISVLTGGGYLQAVPTAPAAVIDPDVDSVTVDAQPAAWQIDEEGQFAYIELDDSNAGQQNSPAFAVCAEVVAQGGAATAVSEELTGGTDGAQMDDLASDLGTLGSSQFICATTAADLNTAGQAIFAYKL